MAANPPLSIRLLGDLEVSRGDASLPLTPSKKTRALLGYLVATRRSHRRERLCDLFWDVADDPRGALRWSLSRLRALVSEPGADRIDADRSGVGFRPEGAHVDVHALDAALSAGVDAVGTDALLALAGEFRGRFLDGLDLPDFPEYQAWWLAERERWRQAHAAVLRALVDRLGDDPEAALPHARALAAVIPEDELGRARLLELLFAAGHAQEAEAQYQLGLRELGALGRTTAPLRSVWFADRARRAAISEAGPAPEPPREAPLAPPPQEIRFCTASDGVRLAYATIGSGPTLVKASNWLSHLEYDWKSPLWRHLAAEMSRDHHLVRYDQRGNGLSDREVEDISFAAFCRDLETVVDACVPGRFSLLGISGGVPIAIAYAAKYPERVDKLILYGGAASGWNGRGPEEKERRTALVTLMRHGWGMENPVFRQVWTSLFMPGASAEQMGWFNELQRISATPEMAARIATATGTSYVKDVLGKVVAPTLVMHATGDSVVPFAEARTLAAGIPNARFVPLESTNHLLLEAEPAWGRFVAELRQFLAR